MRKNIEIMKMENIDPIPKNRVLNLEFVIFSIIIFHVDIF